MRKRNPNPPKQRSLADVHRIWVKAKERNRKRWQMLLDHIDKIGKDLMGDQDGYHYVYYRPPREPDTLCYYQVNVKSHSFFLNNNRVDGKTRKGKIALAVENLSHEYGQELYHIYHHMQTQLDGYIFNTLWEMIEARLREQVRYETFDISRKTFTIDIDGYTYYVCGETYQTGWVKFTWIGEASDTIYLV
jgi:hypothetical protein